MKRTPVFLFVSWLTLPAVCIAVVVLAWAKCWRWM